MIIKDSDVLMIKKDGTVKNIFKNHSEATEYVGIKSRNLISRICNQEYGSCSGYYWLTGKSYKRKQNKGTYLDWLNSNVKISKHVDRTNMPVVKLDKLSYELIERYPNLIEAAKSNNLNDKNGYDSIIKCCKLTRKSAKGYIWLLEDDYLSLSVDKIKDIHNKINNVNPNKKKINKYTMPVVKLDKKTYQKLDSYNNIMEAAIKNDINSKSGIDSIIKCCRFGRKSVSGYTWLLEDDFNTLTIDEIKSNFEKNVHSSLSNRRSTDKTPIVQLKPLSFEFIKVYPSILEASKATNSNKDGIGKCCKFQRRTSGGYSWMYLDDFRNYSLDEIKDLYNKIFWN